MPSSSPILQREESHQHYQTFPGKPPTSRGKPPTSSHTRHSSGSRPRSGQSNHDEDTPLPKRQLAVLAIIALAEQTALNSIAPYLPAMVSSFPDVQENAVGTYVGLVASSFALAQFLTNFFWGWLSDRIGRKPVILLGTLLTSACFVAFGFCRTLWQAIIVQVMIGLVNGNQGVVSTCLGEITNRSNQSQAFTYLPVVYGIGGITGPIVGGLLVQKGENGVEVPYPYLRPNIASAAVLLVELVATMIWLEESMEEAKTLPPLGKRVGSLFAWLWQFTGNARSPTYTRVRSRHRRSSDGRRDGQRSSFGETDDESDAESTVSVPLMIPSADNTGHLQIRDVLNRDVVLILLTFLIFQLGNIAYNSLYPIFGQAKPPIGRNLTPEEIGISLAFAGAVTILFQVGVFNRIRDRMGNKATYRAGLAGFVLAFLAMPFVGQKGDDRGKNISTETVLLWIELGGILIVRTVAAVGGLTSALLLITNSAPDHTVLGTLNGLAQTLSAAGRAIGPFVSGSLFSAATHVHPRGEALAFGVFGGVSFLGLILSFWIEGGRLECGDDWDEEEGVYDSAEDEEGEDHERNGQGPEGGKHRTANGAESK
ncbi:MAG: hypothetical protein M1828_004567 [Chrysothrix sp. TS-e1954]|nr:MAG: hypothetical protein M1828_004567 [Chrysothrix sp. TS-e1954]